MTQSSNSITLVGTLKGIIKILTNPVSIVSIFGPIIINNAFQSLTLSLYRIPSDDTKFGALKSLSENLWVRSIVDFNVQYITLIIAFVLAIIEVLYIVIKSFTSSTDPANQVISELTKDWRMLISTILTIAFVGIMFYFFVSGSIANPDIIKTYYDNINEYGINSHIHPPPLNIITWLRIGISITGFFLSYLLSKVIADHIHH